MKTKKLASLVGSPRDGRPFEVKNYSIACLSGKVGTTVGSTPVTGVFGLITVEGKPTVPVFVDVTPRPSTLLTRRSPVAEIELVQLKVSEPASTLP
jgi:hypothetical protein